MPIASPRPHLETPDAPPAERAGAGLSVLHLGKYYPPAPGGIESHLQTLARAQAEQGAEVRVLCVNHAAADGTDLTWSRFRATKTVERPDGPVRVTRVGRVASVARLDVCPGLPAALRRLFRAAPDVVHLHTPNPAMLMALTVLRPPAPLVVTHHSDVIRQRALRYAQAPLERSVYGRAAAVLATSPRYAEGSAVLRRYGPKLTPLPLGIDLTPYREPSPAAWAYAGKLRSEYGGPLWLAVGRLIYYKGLSVALKALALVPGRLLVVGTGSLEAELRREAEALGVAGRVVWAGYATPDELAGAYRAATALWFPSNARSEGFGLVQVEAMASGCPVINTAIPGSGAAWVSPHGETGLTVPMNDPGALAAAANRLLAEPGLRAQLAAAGRVRAAAEFDHRVMAVRSLGVYRGIVRR
jgi:rhamnosyl/mannosyltransferase